jgi:hypothetical protein
MVHEKTEVNQLCDNLHAYTLSDENFMQHSLANYSAQKH